MEWPFLFTNEGECGVSGTEIVIPSEEAQELGSQIDLGTTDLK